MLYHCPRHTCLLASCAASACLMCASASFMLLRRAAPLPSCSRWPTCASSSSPLTPSTTSSYALGTLTIIRTRCAAAATTTTTATPMTPGGDDALLAFAAARPNLRRLELLAWVHRRPVSGADFLALLGWCCPRCKCWNTQKYRFAGPLLHDDDTTLLTAFAVLRRLEICLNQSW